jgi:hypothetical protein
MHTYKHIDIYINIYKYVHPYINKHMYVHIKIFICIYMYIFIYMYLCIYLRLNITGFRDFFYEPAHALINSPTEIRKIGKGVLLGAMSLAGHRYALI